MSILEFFGTNHGDEQVGEKQQRDDCDKRFHDVLLKPLAKAHVSRAAHEKENDEREKNRIVHAQTMSQVRPGR
jgi:hypothetical protein